MTPSTNTEAYELARQCIGETRKDGRVDRIYKRFSR